MFSRRGIYFTAGLLLLALGIVAAFPGGAQGTNRAVLQTGVVTGSPTGEVTPEPTEELTPAPTEVGDEDEDEFYDRAFIDFMVPSHTAAIEIMQVALQRSTHPELVDYLNAQIAAAQAENEVLLNYREEWFGSREVPHYTEVPLVPNTAEAQMGYRHVNLSPLIQQVHAVEDQLFDQVFLEILIRLHTEAVEASVSTLHNAEHARTYRMAQRMMIEHQMAADQLTMWRDLWFYGEFVFTLPIYEPPIQPTPLPTLPGEPPGDATPEPTEEVTHQPPIDETPFPTVDLTAVPTFEITELPFP